MQINLFQRLEQEFSYNHRNLARSNHLLSLACYMLDSKNKPARESIEALIKDIAVHIECNKPHSSIIEEKEIEDYAEHNKRLRNQ